MATALEVSTWNEPSNTTNRPVAGDIPLLAADLLRVGLEHYGIVVNGVELGGGSGNRHINGTFIERTNYHGWADALVLGNRPVEAMVAPEIGCVMSFRFHDGLKGSGVWAWL